MTCDKCKGLGSYLIINGNEFEIHSCPCKLTAQLYYCNDTAATLIVTEVVNGVMSVLETYNKDPKKYRRLINQLLFEQHLREDIITPINPHPLAT